MMDRKLLGVSLALLSAVAAFGGVMARSGPLAERNSAPLTHRLDRVTKTRIAAGSQLPLRSLAQRRGIGFGTAVKMEPFYSDAQYRKVLAREFNVLTPENALKFGRLSPEQDRYSFKDADALIAFAEVHQMQVHGHTLVWYRNLPDWLTQRRWSRAELIAILQQHIDTVVRRYRGRIAVWDVVNEAIDKDGSLRDSIWLRGIGPEYIAMAFRWAHKADPQAILLYNDYHAEEMNRKSEAVYQLVKKLKQQGVHINDVCWQMHKGIKKPPHSEQMKANMQRLTDLGVEVQITEMDVGVYSGKGTHLEKLAAQADIYRDVMTICLDFEGCSAFTTWGLADHHSWRPAFFKHPDAPLLFNKRYQPKPAYDALIEALR